MALGLGFLAWLFWLKRLPIRSILNLNLVLLRLLSCLLCLLGVVILLEILLRHLSLYDHERGVDERLLEQLTLEHAHQVLDADVFARRSFDDSTVCLDLLLSYQRLLWVRLALLNQGLLVLVEKFR